MTYLLSHPWLVAGVAIATTLVPCSAMCLWGNPERRLVGMEMASVLITVTMIVFSFGFERPAVFIDIPLALAIMSFGGGLVFARFLEKHL